MIRHRPASALARTLSRLGCCSRTRAAEYVRAGRVRVNGRSVVDPEAPVDPRIDRLELDGRPVEPAPPRYLMLNKPRGLVTSARDERGRATVYACLDEERGTWLAPVGRLDRASEGLLLLTNDSAWAARVLDPASRLPRRYHVQIDRRPEDDLCRALEAGVTVEGERMAAHSARVLRAGGRYGWLDLTLMRGRNRHIRRLLQALGIGVRRLVRVAVGPLELGDLAKGAVRPLTVIELDAMRRAIGDAPAGRPDPTTIARPKPARRRAAGNP